MMFLASCFVVKSWAEGLYTDKLVAIHYSDTANKQDSVFEYDSRGNVTLRATEKYREESAYDSQNRRIVRKVYYDNHDEMKLEREQEWEFDAHGNECLWMEMRYNIESGELGYSCRQCKEFDERDRILSDVSSHYVNDGWQQDEALAYTYDDEHGVWTCYEQDRNAGRAKTEHYCDATGQDTLIYSYMWDYDNKDWHLRARTLFTFCEFGVTCELTQGLSGSNWGNWSKMETTYHNSANAYKKARYFWEEDYDCWRDGVYEYNYEKSEGYLHIWGDIEGHRFNDEWRYDEQGRVVWHYYRATSHSSNSDTYEYDEWGNVISVTSTDSMLQGWTEQKRYDYTYDQHGAILAVDYWFKDYFGYSLWKMNTTTFEYDSSVPAAAVLGCPSPYYKLLSVSETDNHGVVTTTTYQYASAEGITGIETNSTADTQAAVHYYDLMGRRQAQPHGLVVKGRYHYL